MLRYVIQYFSTFAVMIPLDLLFLGVIAKPFYHSQIGGLMGEPNMLAAAMFYLLYPVAIVIFVNGATGATVQDCLLFGALLGLTCYATFDLTNMAILRGWTWKMVAVDVLWGAVVTAASATLGLKLAQFIGKQLA